MLDLVSNGDALKRDASLVAPGGKLVSTINSADEGWFREHAITATNVVMSKTPQSSAQSLDELARLIIAGKLVVKVAAERPLDDAPAVLDEVKAGRLTGKIVLHVG